jgi:hypothetical protein
MLNTLLAGGALLQGFKAEMTLKARHAAVLAVFAILALVFLGVGLLALALAAGIALAPHVGGAAAAALVGVCAVGIASLLIWVGTRPRTAAAAASAPLAPAAQPLAGVDPLAAIAGLSAIAASKPVPLMVGALVIGLMLGRRR